MAKLRLLYWLLQYGAKTGFNFFARRENVFLSLPSSVQTAAQLLLSLAGARTLSVL